jgi:RNA polymerase sigma-70 factor (ECF subfamily)
VVIDPAWHERIAAVHAAGRAVWPTVAVELEAFTAHVTACLPAGAESIAVLATEHATDLYLACGVALGQADAVEAFERTLVKDVPLFVAHVDSSRVFVDELTQLLRTNLLVAEAGERPRIATYTGKGPLRGWLRVAAVRTALNLKRGERPDRMVDEDELADVPTAGDPALAYVRSRYAPELNEAFRATLAQLGTDERNVLRLHYLDGLNIEKIGTLYGVHRATVARWLERSRAKLLEATRKLLGERLGVGPDELASLISGLQSQLDVSLRRVL